MGQTDTYLYPRCENDLDRVEVTVLSPFGSDLCYNTRNMGQRGTRVATGPTWPNFGIVSRFRDHLAQFDLAFFEVKDVAGVRHEPIPGTIPMVSVFADNRLARDHADWVQVGPHGMRGDRSAPYFDWDTLCPTRPEVFEQAEMWVRDALSASLGKGIRLGDVTFAREGFCQCDLCRQAQSRLGLSSEAYRMHRITEFVSRCRDLAGSFPVYFTLYPDPYPGHLENRFGLDLEALSQLVDIFVIPVYDLAYSTTYWLEVLAQGFRDRLTVPWLIELYGLGIEEDRLLKAARVARAYADGILIAYDNRLEKLLRIKAELQG